MSLRPAWSTELVPGQPRKAITQRKPVSEKPTSHPHPHKLNKRQFLLMTNMASHLFIFIFLSFMIVSTDIRAATAISSHGPP